MIFSLNETQRMLSDSVARYLTREAPLPGFQATQWEQFSQLGLLGLSVPECYGGLGGSAIDVAVVMEQLGRSAVSNPYVFSVILAGALLEAGNQTQRDRWLGDLASGKALFACALYDTQTHHELLPMTSSAQREESGFILNGAKSNVWYGEHATQVIIAVQSVDGPLLFVLPTETQGLHWHHFPTVDGGSAAQLKIDNVRASPDQMLDIPGSALAAIRSAERRATAALAAESVGLMAVMLESTLDYTRQRRQFGHPIGSFQALQHRMVDMLIELEQARSLAWYAAASFDSPSEDFQQRAVSAAKARAGQAGRHLQHEAIQLHGGMGMADELPLSRYVRRQLAIEQSLGDTKFHIERFSTIEL